ncbi:MAG: hypothetical protein M1837_001606 [Sclerophora amabilis]|nr:MAG: hypothetical protein M1837_001606 [Sclerophora amabilis]
MVEHHTEPNGVPNDFTPEDSSESRYEDGGENGYKQEHAPESPVGFWDSRINHVRRKVFGLWALTTLILVVFIFGVLSLYWAALYHVESNLASLVVYVVDFDGQVAPYNAGEPPLIGPQISMATERQLASPMPHLGYLSKSPSDFNNDPMLVRQAIYDYDAWAAIVVNANATALLRQAIQSGNISYDPMGAAQIIYVQARDEMSHNNYITPMLTQLQTQVTTMFGKMWTSMVLEQASNNATILANLQAAPQAMSPGIGFSTYNLRPFYPPVTTPAISIGLIYLIIISFFSFSFYLPVHTKLLIPEGHPPLKFYQLIIWRWLANLGAYFFLSLFYSLISLAFMIPFSNPSAPETMVAANANAYGKGSFVVYWMLNYVGMIALGLACENVAMILGMPWTAMWLFFWVITNVSTSFYEITLSPRFYYWGYAWPLRNTLSFSSNSAIISLFVLLSTPPTAFGAGSDRKRPRLAIKTPTSQQNAPSWQSNEFITAFAFHQYQYRVQNCAIDPLVPFPRALPTLRGTSLLVGVEADEEEIDSRLRIHHLVDETKLPFSDLYHFLD